MTCSISLPAPRDIIGTYDPEIVPAVGEMYRSRTFPDRLIQVADIQGEIIMLRRSKLLPDVPVTLSKFRDNFIHAAAREDA